MPSKSNPVAGEKWLDAGFERPAVDREKLLDASHKKPQWLHLGANDGCMIPSYLLQKLIEKKQIECGVILAELKEYSCVDESFTSNYNEGVYIRVNSKADIEKRVISSVVETIKADKALYPADWNVLVNIVRNPSLQVISITLGKEINTICTSAGKLNAHCERDCENGPGHTVTKIGKITSLCLERFLAGEYPIALVSFDQCPGNGSKLSEAVVRMAREWETRKKISGGFLRWLNEPEIVTFPWTKIDHGIERDSLPEDSVPSVLPESIVKMISKTRVPKLITGKTAAFIFEDDFPNGRPPLENSDVILTTRDKLGYM